MCIYIYIYTHICIHIHINSTCTCTICIIIIVIISIDVSSHLWSARLAREEKDSDDLGPLAEWTEWTSSVPAPCGLFRYASVRYSYCLLCLCIVLVCSYRLYFRAQVSWLPQYTLIAVWSRRSCVCTNYRSSLWSVTPRSFASAEPLYRVGHRV